MAPLLALPRTPSVPKYFLLMACSLQRVINRYES
jgi:hypothetical protein